MKKTNSKEQLFSAIEESDSQRAIEILGKILKKDYAAEVLMTQDDDGWTPIHWAVAQTPNLQERFLRQILSVKGLHFDIVNKDKNTPLHYFCSRFTSPECQELFELMIENGVDINAVNKLNETGIPYH